MQRGNQHQIHATNTTKRDLNYISMRRRGAYRAILFGMSLSEGLRGAIVR